MSQRGWHRGADDVAALRRVVEATRAVISQLPSRRRLQLMVAANEQGQYHDELRRDCRAQLALLDALDAAAPPPPEPPRFMPELFRIVRGALDGDAKIVLEYSKFLAQRMRDAGDVETSERLVRLINGERRFVHTAGNAPSPEPERGESAGEMGE